MNYSFSLPNKKYNVIIISCFFMIMLSLFAVFSSLELQAPMHELSGKLLGYLSVSAGNPFFIVSSAVLALIAFFIRQSYQQLIIVYLQFALILLLSFVLKSVVKSITEVPRPFTEQLVEQGFVASTLQFYELDQQQKNNVIVESSEHFPQQRIDSWLNESNYSFPSGHTIFVATCVVFWGGLFLRQGRFILVVAVVTWASGVAFSRYWLGMHWPTDILASIICAGLLMILVPDISPCKNNTQ